MVIMWLFYEEFDEAFIKQRYHQILIKLFLCNGINNKHDLMRFSIQKSWEFFKKKSQNENIFVKIGKLFANFDKNILILRKLGTFFCLFLMIISRFLSVYPYCDIEPILLYSFYFFCW